MADYKIQNFYELDFKDLSEKLENTDKKVQFWVQIYITLISSVLVLDNIKNISLFATEKMRVVIFFTFYLLGQILFFYILSSHLIRTEYICKMNTIRSLFLDSFGKPKYFIEKYGFTECKHPKKTGMTWIIIYLELIATFGFAFLTTSELFKINEKTYSYCILELIIIVNILILVIHGKTLKKTVNTLKKNRQYLLNKKD